MANLRPMLFMGLLVLSYLMWVEWDKDYGVKPQPKPVTEATKTSLDTPSLPVPQNATSTAGDLPAPDAGLASPEQESISQAVMTGANELVTVTTDLLEVKIDRVGGTVVSARLLDYPVELDVPGIKVDLFNISGPELFIAQSGLLSRSSAPNHTSTYQTDVMQYDLGQTAEEIRVPLTWTDSNGIQVTKTLIFKRGKYDITVRHTLSNHSDQSWSGSRYDQLQRSILADKDDGGFTNPGRYSFFGIGFYSPDEKLEKVDFDDVASEPYERSFADGWLSMVQHYFFSAWIPPQAEINTYSTQVYSPDGFPRYIARAVSPAVEVNAGASHEFESRLYVGPKLQDEIEEVAPGLDYTVNYGIFTVFSKPLFWLLSNIHKVVGNWGWAIVLLTVLIKLLFFKLTEAQYRSMARMRKLQPRIEQLKEIGRASCRERV